MESKKKFQRAVADTFELPKEILLDLPRVNLVGNIQLYVENHRGVVEYTDETVRISISGGELVIQGKNLQIKNIFSGEIFIEGTIHRLDYEN